MGGWIDRVREREKFVWESVYVAIIILEACTCLCNNYFFKSLYLYSVKIAKKK